MKNFKKAMEFQSLLQQFNSVYRDLESIHDSNINDNDAEHSFRVALLCWMIIEEYKLNYNVPKVLKYALLHDLVETYAGDCSLYANYSQEQKVEKEHKALLKLKRTFPKLKALWSTIEQYEKRKDKESKFVYLIEKLEPVYTVLLTDTEHWRKRGISLEDFIDRKQRKIKHLELEAQIFNKETMDYLKKHKKKYF